MNQRAQSFAELAVNTTKQLTGSYAEWTAFLEVIGRLYKYPYYEQVLIYAQRPDATACASFDVWNKRMNRAVRRGSRGIALLDTTDGNPKIRYVFDIADTVGRDKSRRPYLWQYHEEQAEQITATLADSFGVAADNDLPYQLEVIADDLAGEYWAEHYADILACVPGTFLEDYDEFNIEAAFRSAASASTTYAMLSRCGLNPDEYFSHEDFMNVFDFNTPDAATALGTAVSENSEQVLRQIEIAIKNYERDRRAERSNEHGEQLNLPAGWGLPAAGVGYRDTIDLGEIRTDEEAVSEGASSGTVQPPDTQREADGAPDRDRPDSEPSVGADHAPDDSVHGDIGADESVRPNEMGGADEQRQIEGGGNDTGGADLPVTTAPEVDFAAVGPTGLEFSHRENEKSAVPYFEDVSEKRELLWKADALKDRRAEIAVFFAAHTAPNERSQYVKGFFTNTYIEVILDSGQRVGYRAYDDVLHLWRGSFPSREQEEYLSWEDAASAIDGMIQDGLWIEQPKIPAPIPAPKKKPVKKEDEYAFNLFDMADSVIPLTNEPVGEPIVIRPQVSQDVIDAALTIGANDPDSRLRIIAEFMKDKPLEENTRFLQTHYKENGAGFYVGERKYSLWYNEAGMQIAAGESALTDTATAVTWEQAAGRIRELLDEGKYADQSTLSHAWPYELHRIVKKILDVHYYINESFKGHYLTTLDAALGSDLGFSDMEEKTEELLMHSEQLKTMIDEFTVLTKDYAHNRGILRSHYYMPQEITQELEDLQRASFTFTASPDYEPVERFFISQDEIDNLLRESWDHNEYRIGVYNYFEKHPGKNERDKYLSHLHGDYGGYVRRNDDVIYTYNELTFAHGDETNHYAEVRLEWPQVRKRIEELIDHDAFLSAEDRDIMEGQTLESEDENLAPLDKAKELINEFCQSEYDGDADFSDLSRVEIGYTETEDGLHPMQFFADLVKYRIVYEVDGQSVFSVQCNDLDELNEYLGNLDFQEMAGDAEEQYEAQTVDNEQNLTPDVEGYQKLRRQFPGMLVGVQVGDTMLFYGEDAKKAAPALGTKIVEREIPGLGDVEVTGSSHAWQAVLKKLLEHGLDVTLARPDESGSEYEVILSRTAAEYIPVGMVVESEGRRAQIESVDFRGNIVRIKLLDTDYSHLLEPVAYVRELVEEANDRNMERDMAAMPDDVSIASMAGVEQSDGPDPRYEVIITSDAYPDMEDSFAIWDHQKDRYYEENSGWMPAFPTEQWAEAYLAELLAQPELSGNPIVREVYDFYVPIIKKMVMGDVPYQNACKNSDKETAMIEGDAAVKRAALVVKSPLFMRIYYDMTDFRDRMHREIIDETYSVLREQERSAPKEEPLSDTPSAIRDPLAPAYKVGDTVYLEDTAFTITDINLHDVQLQDPTLSYPIFRSENKDNFEKMLRRDERNLPITDYYALTSIAPLDNGDDLRDVLTSEGGLLDTQAKLDIGEWLRKGLGNEEIARRLEDKYDRTDETMTLETGEPADYRVSGNSFILDLRDKYRTMMMYDLRTVAGVLRAMYQQELGGFSHTPSAPVQEPPSPEVLPEPKGPAYTTKTVAVYPAEKNNIPFDIVIETLHVDEPKLENFHITDDNLGAGGAKAKYQMNMAALKTLHQIESENRTATPEEQETLSKYVGWGALQDAFDPNIPTWASEYKELQEIMQPDEYDSARASVLNSHYTSPTVIKAIYQALENMGFQGGNILEPSCGVGNFFGLLPESMAKSKLYGVELDGLTGRIAQQLYPNAHIEIKGYEQTNFEKNSFDVAIGNVPFGNYKVHDPAYNKLGFSIHNYFFAKAIDQVRPGGIVAFVTSRYTMDSKNTDAREYIAQRAELLGAIRLPDNAFLANAGTEVVTDILFLQKREQPTIDLPDWVFTDKNTDGYTVNRYFIQHPKMVMGTETFDSTRYGYDYTVVASIGADLGSMLGEAIKHINGQYVAAESAELDDAVQEETILADPAVKNFSYTIIKGDVYYRQDSVMVKMELGATAKARTTALIGLRDCTQQLIRKQMALSNSDGEIKSVQAELNRLYDTFTKKFGLINDKINERAFSDDSSYYLLCALEILDDDGKFVRKADMFTKRTILPRQEITHVDTATEALAVSIGERARVDIPYMAGLTGKTEDEIINDLQGQIYPVPFHGQGGRPIYQTADEYLSGNVRQKLSLAQAAAASDPTTYEINVDALTAALPRDLDASEIQVRLGATWVDPEYVDQFMRELLKTPGYAYDAVHVRYSPQVNVWNISNKGSIRKNDVAAFTTYGTARASAYELLEDALNLQNTQIFDLKEDLDGNDKRVLNVKETTLAQQKQSMIKLEFQNWIWRDPDRRQKLVRKYNDEMNCIRPRQYDGSHLVLDGMNPEIQLEEHQKNAIARAVYGGNTLFAHCVGAGKTFEITASAMEMKRLGLCSKSMIVVPNHLTQQWASEFLRLYPNANILVTTKRDFEKNRRKKFCSRIATGDYDAVIIGYSQFEKVPISKQRQIDLLFEQIRDITNGIEMAKMESGERYTVKYMERTKRSLEARLRKLQADDKKDDVVCFEELGIDRLFVDEADNYKNMFLYTKMRNVAGLSTSEAQKSTDLFNKTRYLDEITDYKGTIFATGTPISNSITEMYTMQRYLQYNALKGMGIDHFDSWASRFGETTTTMELAPEGTGYRPRTRFAKFFNLPELMNIFYEVADIKTEDMLNLPTPDVEYHNEVAKPTEYQREYVQELSKRATAVRNRVVDSKEDNMLCITNDGRKLGLDQRLIDPFAGDDPSSKLNKCIENILAFWQNGKEEKLTQLVFCDNSTPKKDGTFNVYSDIKSKLVAHGVPEDEVAFIHDADTEAKKKELFGKVRSGKVRVLIGSTQKMGAGTNCQDRLIALHHLDCPWRPRDLTQREGRIKRRGNMNPLVHVFRYVTENTFDSYLWQTVEKKQQFIGQIMTSKSPVRSCEDVDEAALSYAEVKALCAGDPRIKERMELDIDVAKLQVMQASHRSQQYELEDKIRLFYPQEQQRLEWRIEGIQQDMDTLAAHSLPKEGFVGMDLLGQHFDERKKAGIVLLNECKNAKVFTTSKVGEYRGLEVYVKKHNLISEPQILLKGAVEYAFTAGDSDIGNITRLDNVPDRLPEELEKAKVNLENTKQQLESAKLEVGKPFPQEKELQDKLARIAELDIALKMKDGSEKSEIDGAQYHVEDRTKVSEEISI